MLPSFERRGLAGGPRVALIHGFGQDAGAWGPYGDALARAHELIVFDAPGHGRSREVLASIEESAALFARAAPGPAHWIGYSMGGRMALRLALDFPELVTRLTLIGATAGIDEPAAREARLREDLALADRLEAIGCARFFDEHLARPMFADLSEPLRFRAAREAQSPRALAAQLRRAGTGAMEPLWGRLGELRAPARFIAGALDEPFVRSAERMAAACGGEAVAIAGARHAAHLVAPEAVAAATLA